VNKTKVGCSLFALLLFSASFLGAAWTTNRLSYTPGWSGEPDIAIDGSNVYVVWSDETPGNTEIYFRKSTDGGATWQAAKRLTNNAGESGYPAIAVVYSNIYVVWGDSTPEDSVMAIYFMRSTDGGITWQSAQRLTYTAKVSCFPAIAANYSKVYLVWWDDTPGNREIYFRNSLDSGVTWQTAKRLTYNSEVSSAPHIVVSGPSVYLTWFNAVSGNKEIYFRKSADGGITWKSAKRLTNNAGESYVPVLAVGGANVYVTWQDDTPGNKEIYFRRSVDGGATWQVAQRLTDNSGSSCYPAISVYAANVYVAWVDDTSEAREIYFRRSADSSVTWKSAIKITNDAVFDEYMPSRMASNINKVFVVYFDETPGNYEIYLKYSPVSAL